MIDPDLIAGVIDQLRACLAGRKPDALRGDDWVRFCVLRSRLDTLLGETRPAGRA